MSNWVLIAVYELAVLYGMLHGLLMLVSPEIHRRFNLRVNDPFRRLKLPPLDRETDRGLELEHRLAGFLLVLGCSVMAWGGLDTFVGHAKSPSNHGTTHMIAIGKDWWGFVAAAICFVFGAYAFLQPHRVYGWTTGRLLPSGVAPPEPNQIRRGMRFLGTCFIVLGLILFWLGLKRQ